MADLSKPTAAPPPLPREWNQIASLLEMRWQVFTRSLRTNDGRVALIFRIAGRLFLLGLAAGAGVVAGLVTFWALDDHHASMLGLVFLGLFAGWQFLLVARGSLSHGVEHELARFPLRFRTYLELWLTSGLFDGLTIIGSFVGVGIAAGARIADVPLASALGIPLLFVAFNIVLSRLLYLWLNRLLARRRTREVFLVLLSLLGLLPRIVQTLDRSWLRRTFGSVHWPPALVAAGRWMPHAVAARALLNGSRSALLAMCGYLLLTAALLLRGLLRAYRGEAFHDGSVAAARRRATRAAAAVSTEADTPGHPAFLVAGVEWLRMRHSTQGLYQLVTPLLLIVVFGLRSARGSHGDWALAGAAAYLALGLRATNVFGFDGTGVQSYLLFPQPIRRVLLGKNLFAVLVVGVQFVAAALLIALVHGSLSASVISFSLLWCAGYTGLAMRIGNQRSLTSPLRMQETGRIQPGAFQRRQRAPGAWWSILLLLGGGGLGAALVGVSLWLNRPWLASLLVLPFTATGIELYRRGLRNPLFDGRPAGMEAVLSMVAKGE